MLEVSINGIVFSELQPSNILVILVTLEVSINGIVIMSLLFLKQVVKSVTPIVQLLILFHIEIL